MNKSLPISQFNKVNKKVEQILESDLMSYLIFKNFRNLTKSEKRFLRNFNNSTDTLHRIVSEIKTSKNLNEGATKILNEWIPVLARAVSVLTRAGRAIGPGLRRMFGRSRLKDLARRGPKQSRKIARDALKTRPRARIPGSIRRIPKRIGRPPSAMMPDISKAAKQLLNMPKIRRAFSRVSSQCRLGLAESIRGRCANAMGRLWNWFKGYVSNHFKGTWTQIFGQWLNTGFWAWTFSGVFDWIKGKFGMGDVEPEEITQNQDDAISGDQCYDKNGNMISFDTLLSFLYKRGLTPERYGECNSEVKSAIYGLEQHLGIDSPDGVFDAEVALAAVGAGLINPDRDEDSVVGDERDDEFTKFDAVRPRWCRRARTETEQTICSNSELWPFERRNIELCKKADCIRSNRTAVRSFIQTRNSCGGDIDCIKAAYRARFKELGSNQTAPQQQQAAAMGSTAMKAAAGTVQKSPYDTLKWLGAEAISAPSAGAFDAALWAHKKFSAASPISEDMSVIKKRFKKLLK